MVASIISMSMSMSMSAIEFGYRWDEAAAAAGGD
jgi:hypothetical protein